jgi:hypothetical protein
MREAKISDNAALDHWKNDARGAEENIKRQVVYHIDVKKKLYAG